MTAKLTSKQEMFCLEYLIDLNATQAAIRAGYSEKTAQRIASENLSKPLIQERIDTLMRARSIRVNVDAQYVLERLYSIDQMDFMDILNDDMSFKSVSQWPKIWRQYISSFDIAEMFEHKGDEKVLVGILKKIKWPDKVKNLELLGKHVSVKAFEKEISVQNNIHHIMPVPTANSVEDWEKASEETHEANLQNRS